MSALVGKHAEGKLYVDKILKAGNAASVAISKYGKDKVINGSNGVMRDEEGSLICLPTIEKVFRGTKMVDMSGYAPIGGLPGYQEAAIKHTFGDFQPEGYIKAIATPGGTGAVSAVVWNYSDPGDEVLTHSWFWTPYRTICTENGRYLRTFSLFDENNQFNFVDFEAKVKEILRNQERLVIILNTPGNNPTGYTLSNQEWDHLLDSVRSILKNRDKSITLLLDIAYIDFVNDPVDARAFMKKLSGLPENIFITFAFSMSKSFTLYGQRTGAVIGLSASEEVITEFAHVTQVTGRTRWSSVTRGSMHVMATIFNDLQLIEDVNEERSISMELIAKRAELFMQEADSANMNVLPYRGGFFITVPTETPEVVCEYLSERNIFMVPLSGGVRIAVCSIPKNQIKGLAAKVNKALCVINQK